eukprot:4690541-Amphidinium_carterae.1
MEAQVAISRHWPREELWALSHTTICSASRRFWRNELQALIASAQDVVRYVIKYGGDRLYAALWKWCDCSTCTCKFGRKLSRVPHLNKFNIAASHPDRHEPP